MFTVEGCTNDFMGYSEMFMLQDENIENYKNFKNRT